MAVRRRLLLVLLKIKFVYCVWLSCEYSSTFAESNLLSSIEVRPNSSEISKTHVVINPTYQSGALASYSAAKPSRGKPRRQLPDAKHEHSDSPESAPLDSFDIDTLESSHVELDYPPEVQQKHNAPNKTKPLTHNIDIEQLVRSQLNLAAFDWMNAGNNNRESDKLADRNGDFSGAQSHRNHNYGLMDSGNDFLLRQIESSTVDPLTTLSDASADYAMAQNENGHVEKSRKQHPKNDSTQDNYPGHYVYRLRGPTQLPEPMSDLYWQFNQEQSRLNTRTELQQPDSSSSDSDSVIVKKPTKFGDVTVNDQDRELWFNPEALLAGNVSPEGYMDLSLNEQKSSATRDLESASRWLKGGKLHVDHGRQPILLISARNKTSKLSKPTRASAPEASTGDQSPLTIHIHNNSGSKQVPAPILPPSRTTTTTTTTTTTSTTPQPETQRSVNIEGSLANRLSANRWKHRLRHESTTPYSAASTESVSEPPVDSFRPPAEIHSSTQLNSTALADRASQAPLFKFPVSPFVYKEKSRPETRMRVPLIRVPSNNVQQQATSVRVGSGWPTSTTVPMTTPMATTLTATSAPPPLTFFLRPNETNALRNELAHHHHLHSHIHSIKNPAVISIPMPLMQSKHDSYENLVAAAAAAAAAAATASASRVVRIGKKQSHFPFEPYRLQHSGSAAETLARILRADALARQQQQQSHHTKTIPIGGTLASIPSPLPVRPNRDSWNLVGGNEAARASSRFATILGSANRAFKQVAGNAASLLNLQAANSNIVAPIHTDPNPFVRHYKPPVQPIKQARREFPLVSSNQPKNNLEEGSVPLALFQPPNEISSPEVIALLSHLLSSQTQQQQQQQHQSAHDTLEDYQPDEQRQALNMAALPDPFALDYSSLYELAGHASGSSPPIDASNVLGELILDDSLFSYLKDSKPSSQSAESGGQPMVLQSHDAPVKYNPHSDEHRAYEHELGEKLTKNYTSPRGGKGPKESRSRYIAGNKAQPQEQQAQYALGHYAESDQMSDLMGQKGSNGYSIPNWVIDSSNSQQYPQPPQTHSSPQAHSHQQHYRSKYSQPFGESASSQVEAGFRPILLAEQPSNSAGSIQALKSSLNKQQSASKGVQMDNHPLVPAFKNLIPATAEDKFVFGDQTNANHPSLRLFAPVHSVPHVIHSAGAPTHYIYQPSEVVQHAIYHASNLLRPYLVSSAATENNYKSIYPLHHYKSHADKQHDMSTSESATRLSSIVAAPLRGQLLPNFWPIALAMIPIMIIIAIMAQLVMAAPLAMFALTTLAVSRFTGTMFGPAAIRGKTVDDVALFPLLFDSTNLNDKNSTRLAYEIDNLNKKPLENKTNSSSNATQLLSKRFSTQRRV